MFPFNELTVHIDSSNPAFMEQISWTAATENTQHLAVCKRKRKSVNQIFVCINGIASYFKLGLNKRRIKMFRKTLLVFLLSSWILPSS